ncbi:hypothetical protein GCM10018980_33170 [Streptomyces capoamus]|uniref:Peptidase C14 caspase domain-containing protein n=1 Tax=Streptomyces capoamus TaxID=68183 RepID=A0A919EVN2_9ACTN|nr:caspase family protein [Streptomyces capoamus]GGW10025.1 hypothetical protein GCM10010501_03830 [Streptomyces libani subsp. rufus]GHG51046.1 hypothetical protein GCM10018980_33170 [Streptomyces capoamus]
MTLRALLIGAQTFGLEGVHADIERMERALAGRGFTDVDVRTRGRATYAGVTEGLGRLRHATRPGDGVVVYYSGHGGLTDGLQYLVPTDLAESTATDFRGLLAEELTDAVRALTLTTPNVTCVLDCCHSGGAVRDTALGPGRRALKSVRLPKIPADAARTRAEALAHRDLPLVPHVVRLTACEQHGSAYEGESEPGSGRQGLFTAALADLLDAGAGRRIPWSVLVARVRDRLAQRGVPQRPDAGGPSQRLPFSLDECAGPGRLPLRRGQRRFSVPGGALFGLGPQDDVMMVFPGDAPADEGRETRVPATVEDMCGGDALLTVDTSRVPPSLAEELTSALLPPGSHVLAVRVHDRRNVRVDLPGPRADALLAELARSPRLAVTDSAADAFAVVRLRAGAFQVLTHDGRLLRKPCDPALADVSGVAELLEDLARGDRLRRLRTPRGTGRLMAPAGVRIEGRHPPAGGDWRPLRPVGERLYPGDHYRVGVTNRSRTPLYFWVLDIGLSGRTALVTADQPSGYRVEPGTRRATRPVALYWPRDVPEDGPRPETVHVLVGDRPMDLSGLASRQGGAGARAAPALPALLREVADGTRGRAAGPDALRYRVWTVEADVPAPGEGTGEPAGATRPRAAGG